MKKIQYDLMIKLKFMLVSIKLYIKKNKTETDLSLVKFAYIILTKT
jgi:hypothetical protein